VIAEALPLLLFAARNRYGCGPLSFAFSFALLADRNDGDVRTNKQERAAKLKTCLSLSA
jgi:hypothetical protein